MWQTLNTVTHHLYIQFLMRLYSIPFSLRNSESIKIFTPHDIETTFSVDDAIHRWDDFRIENGRTLSTAIYIIDEYIVRICEVLL